MTRQLQAKILVNGKAAQAEGFALSAPISFWGGVNPQTGLIANVRHPEYGQSVAGQVLCLPATIGSSSAAAVLLELVYANLAPAAIILHEPDAILLLGLIVASEMGWEVPIAVQLDRSHYAELQGRPVEVTSSGGVIIH